MKPTSAIIGITAVLVLIGLPGTRREPTPAASAAPVHAEPELQRFVVASALMGVRMNIILYAPDQSTAEAAGSQAFQRIAEIEQIASTYRKTSELKQLEKRVHKGPTPVSDDLFQLLSMSLDLHSKTGGAFDCTVGHLVELWRDANKSGSPPSELLAGTLRMIGESKDLILDPEQQTAELKDSIAFNLDAIAKGYAGDEALKVLRNHGVKRALIDLSGDIVLGEPPPGADYWSIELDFGDPEIQTIKLRLANAAVATSGDTEQHFVVQGVRYSHIIDPRSGMACTNRSAACVIAPTGALADALATASCVLGAEDAPAMIARFDRVSARVRTQPDNNQPPDDITTPGFNNAAVQETEPSD